jgi:hypothetical protein
VGRKDPDSPAPIWGVMLISLQSCVEQADGWRYQAFATNTRPGSWLLYQEACDLTVEFIEPMYAFAVSGRGRYLWTRVLIEPLVQLPSTSSRDTSCSSASPKTLVTRAGPCL